MLSITVAAGAISEIRESLRLTLDGMRISGAFVFSLPPREGKVNMNIAILE